MIVEEYPFMREEGPDYGLIKHYSDEGYIMRQIETGFEYGEAIDIYPCPYTYEETDKKAEEETESEVEPEI